MRQARYWLLTIREADFDPYTPVQVAVLYIRGQLETGTENGFRHWQLYLHTKVTSVKTIKKIYPTAHIEMSRSKAAEEYVWKEETRIEGTQFEKGVKPANRSSKNDWSEIKKNAAAGQLDKIPEDVFVR